MAERRRSAGPPEAVVDSGTATLVPDPDRPRAWTLYLDGVPQSHVDLGDPTHLEFEYIRRIGHVIDLLAAPGTPLRALHLGGGAFTLPRYIAATRPRSGQQVVEIDAALVSFVRSELPFDRQWRIRVRNGDARKVLAKAPADAFDLVVADVFASGRTPAHLTSTDFVSLAARTLRTSGVYVANVADCSPLGFVRSQLATVGAVFPHVMLLAEPGVLRGRRFGNLVVIASRLDPPVDLQQLTRLSASDPFAGRVLYGRELTDFTVGAAPLTDATTRPSPTPPESLFQ